VAALGVVALLGSSTLQAQQAPAAPAPAAQAPAAPPDAMKFAAGSPAALLYIVKAAKVADFDLFWSTIRSKIAAGTAAASATPEQKAEFEKRKEELAKQMASLKIFKIPGDPSKPDADQNYLFYIDAAAGLSYSPTELLYNSGLFERAEADQMFAKLKEALTNILAWPLTKVS
jgi:hypothetical protein